MIGIIEKTPVLLIDNKVAWVIGYTIAEDFKVKQIQNL